MGLVYWSFGYDFWAADRFGEFEFPGTGADCCRNEAAACAGVRAGTSMVCVCRLNSRGRAFLQERRVSVMGELRC